MCALPTRMFPLGTERNPYVTDGLVAWWDGEWNAGFRRHTSVKTGMKEIISGCQFTPIESDPTKTKIVIGPNYIDFNRLVDSQTTGGDATFSTFVPGLADIIAANTTMTIELVGIPDTSFIQTFANQRWGMRLFVGGNASTSRFRRFWQGGNMAASFNGRLYYDQSLGARDLLNTMLAWQAKRHTALVARMTSTTTNAIDYIDGVRTNPSWADYWSGSSSDPSNEIRFGLGVSSAAIVLPCRFYSIRIYSRALSDAEIAANYAIDKARFNLP